MLASELKRVYSNGDSPSPSATLTAQPIREVFVKVLASATNAFFHHSRRATQRLRFSVTAAVLGSLPVAAPLGAQIVPRFDTGIVVGGDWLQANALPLDRDAFQSSAVTVSIRRQTWAVEAGWLRIARTLSTVQGGSLSVGPLLHWGGALFLPSVGVLGGKASASRDTTGYDWVGAQGITGHQPRYSYSSASTFGGGVGLTVEYPLYRGIAARGLVSQWYFSGAPLEGDRARTLLGAGLSLRVGR